MNQWLPYLTDMHGSNSILHDYNLVGSYMCPLHKSTEEECIKNLEWCKISCYNLERMVDSLSWFVGGNEILYKTRTHQSGCAFCCGFEPLGYCCKIDVCVSAGYLRAKARYRYPHIDAFCRAKTPECSEFLDKVQAVSSGIYRERSHS